VKFELIKSPPYSHLSLVIRRPGTWCWESPQSRSRSSPPLQKIDSMHPSPPNSQHYHLHCARRKYISHNCTSRKPSAALIRGIRASPIWWRLVLPWFDFVGQFTLENLDVVVDASSGIETHLLRFLPFRSFVIHTLAVGEEASLGAIVLRLALAHTLSSEMLISHISRFLLSACITLPDVSKE